MKELPSAHSERMVNPDDLAVVGLGSNLGDSRSVLLSAFDRLAAFSDAPIARSSLWRSSPVDCPPGSPPFVNAVAVFVPTPKLTPEVLIGSLQALERECGRRAKKQINEPRPLDLDLIWFRQERRQGRQLTLPHPRAHLRRFVLQPLAELVSDAIFPGMSATVGELLAGLPSGEQVELLEFP